MTVVIEALLPDSELREAVRDGMQAVASCHRDCFDTHVRAQFSDGLDLEAAFRTKHPNDSRWDYLLGHRPSGHLVAVEPHAYRDGDVAAVIAKRRWALAALATELAEDRRVSTWLWVATGRAIAPTEQLARRLDQNGICRVSRVLEKHLPVSDPRRSAPTRATARRSRRSR